MYSDRGLLTSQSTPSSGTTTHTYGDHGWLISTLDARGVTVTRTVDAYDRVTGIHYPDPNLDTLFTYDDPAVAFSKGRLTSVSRHGQSITYEYDRFGRMTRDGILSYSYDENGNRVRIGHPFGALAIDAVYTFDSLDRPATLTLEPVAGSPLPIVTAASYLPLGPLTHLTLGNGLSENRSYDARYRASGDRARERWAVDQDGDHPLELGSDRRWGGQSDRIGDLLDPANNRTFGYQDYQYFLTQGDGPWGSLGWTYDKAGNRLSETRNGSPTAYTYELNGSGGNSPRLLQAGSSTFGYDAVGNLTSIASSKSTLDLTYDDQSRLARMNRAAGPTVDLSYDGRSLMGGATRFMPPLSIGKSAALATRANPRPQSTGPSRPTTRAPAGCARSIASSTRPVRSTTRPTTTTSTSPSARSRCAARASMPTRCSPT